MGETRKRKRPSAKETRERMARAAASNTPITRAAEPPPAPEEREPVPRETAPGPHAGTKKPAKASPGKGRSVGTRGSREGRAAGSAAANGAAGGEAAPPAAEGKLTRLSVDVPRPQHVFLRVEAAQAGTTGMAVVRALIAEMQDDAELAGRIRDRLAAGE